MPATRNQLFNVPPPEFFEAVSGWLSRLALSQGASLSEVMDFFHLRNDFDLDRIMQGWRLTKLRQICGLPESAFAVHERIIVALNSMRSMGDEYLIRARGDNPRFRYCPLCLRMMRTPHFPIHWRFVAWRWCPEHDCLLEDTCHQCGKMIVFPIDIESSAAGKQGYALLDRCQSCGALLSDTKPCYLQLGTFFRRVSELEELTLANGRGLLSALYHGWFEIKGQPGRLELTRFSEIERYWVLPVTLEWLTPEEVRKRNPRVVRLHLPTAIERSANQWQGRGFKDCDLPRNVRIQYDYEVVYQSWFRARKIRLSRD